jgi:hypothetical protein
MPATEEAGVLGAYRVNVYVLRCLCVCVCVCVCVERTLLTLHIRRFAGEMVEDKEDMLAEDAAKLDKELLAKTEEVVDVDHMSTTKISTLFTLCRPPPQSSSSSSFATLSCARSSARCRSRALATRGAAPRSTVNLAAMMMLWSGLVWSSVGWACCRDELVSIDDWLIDCSIGCLLFLFQTKRRVDRGYVGRYRTKLFFFF